ncbi:hypothetical protein F5884DRAFT_784915 [Xylogone sp. PMI_703]|nr:hypothetical protein F5884DRAFT_784915 [Xylogone sp. PMI_703]
MASSSILLQNATIIVPSGQGDDRVVPLRGHSLLIEGKTISCITPHIEPPSSSTEVIDCTGKIISPGFIDTHHHVWQTQLKGRHGDHSLLAYIPAGNMQSYNYTTDDIFWGELGGCLEAINAGTTTIVDHAHMNYSPEHNSNAISATASSGIRSIFCYTPTARVKSWKPSVTFEESLLPDWVMKQLEELSKASPFGDGRVHLGLAFDAVYLPKELVVDLFERCRRAGIKLITSHYARGAVLGSFSIVDAIDAYGLLNSDILISHASNLSSSDAAKLTKAGASISSTPDTELQMGLGYPVCFQDDVKAISSLGIDCHSNNSADIVGQMRLSLQAERGRRNEALIQQGKAAKQLDISVQDAFRLGTIQGARAIKMQNEIGSLEEGKRADIVIFDALSPGLICAAEEDPVAAIVLHSSVADIEAVIVDGQFRKRGGSLLPVTVENRQGKVEWRDVATELLKSRQKIQEAERKNGAADHTNAIEDVIGLFQMDKNNLV